MIQAALTALGSAYGKQAADFSIDQIKGWFDRASTSLGRATRASSSELQRLVESAFKPGAASIDTEISRRNLARWFEIPGEEFDFTPTEQLEPEVLIRHIYLEDLFKEWLTKWGYDVAIGEDLEGRESIDFTPDVYGCLETVHGKFELCVSLVCDNPPSQYRVRALLETLEAFATDRSEFQWGDVFILSTPFQFGRGSAASIRLQSKEESYTVVKLEGEDIHTLLTARDDRARLVQLMQKVEHAREMGPEGAKSGQP